MTRIAFLFAYGLVLGWFGARLARGLIRYDSNDIWFGIIGIAVLGILICLQISKGKRPKPNGGTKP
ncbi:MAG: hypothetical protein WCI21_10190 [Alphaproteobacteria bacterium]